MSWHLYERLQPHEPCRLLPPAACSCGVCERTAHQVRVLPGTASAAAGRERRPPHRTAAARQACACLCASLTEMHGSLAYAAEGWRCSLAHARCQQQARELQREGLRACCLARHARSGARLLRCTPARVGSSRACASSLHQPRQRVLVPARSVRDHCWHWRRGMSALAALPKHAVPTL